MLRLPVDIASPPHGGADRNFDPGPNAGAIPGWSPPHGGADRNKQVHGELPVQARRFRRPLTGARIETINVYTTGSGDRARSRPLTGARIETPQATVERCSCSHARRPLTGARIETTMLIRRPPASRGWSPPHGGADRNQSAELEPRRFAQRRPLTGGADRNLDSRYHAAMVEVGTVAPSRGRGSKRPGLRIHRLRVRRPLTGARIETRCRAADTATSPSPPHGGADRNVVQRSCTLDRNGARSPPHGGADRNSP